MLIIYNCDIDSLISRTIILGGDTVVSLIISLSPCPQCHAIAAWHCVFNPAGPRSRQPGAHLLLPRDTQLPTPAWPRPALETAIPVPRTALARAWHWQWTISRISTPSLVQDARNTPRPGGKMNPVATMRLRLSYIPRTASRRPLVLRRERECALRSPCRRELLHRGRHPLCLSSRVDALTQ